MDLVGFALERLVLLAVRPSCTAEVTGDTLSATVAERTCKAAGDAACTFVASAR